MVISCCAYGCKERAIKGSQITFHSFPIDPVRKAEWMTKIKRENFIPSKYSKVCSKHFEEDCFDREKLGGTWLKNNAVPTLFIFNEFKPIRKPPTKPLTPDINLTTEPKKRKHYVGDFIDVDMDSPTKAKKALNLAKIKLSEQAKKLKLSNQKEKRLEKKICYLKEMLTILKKRSLISQSASDVLERERKKRKALDTADIDEIENDNSSVEKEENSDEKLTTPLAAEDSIFKEHPSDASEEIVDKSAAISDNSVSGSSYQSKEIEPIGEKVTVDSTFDDDQNDGQSTNKSMEIRNRTSSNVFDFKTLKEGNFVSRPWTTTSDRVFISFLYWKVRHVLERWIVVDKKLKAKVYLKGVEAKALNCEIDSPETLKKLLKRVERATICEGRSNEYSYCTGIPEPYEFGKTLWLCKHCQNYEKRARSCKKCSQHAEIVCKKNLLIKQLKRKVQKYEALLNIQKKDSQGEKSDSSKRSVSHKGSDSEECLMDLMTSKTELTEMSPLSPQGSSRRGQSNVVKSRIKPSNKKASSKSETNCSKSMDELSNDVSSSENALSARLIASENEPETVLLFSAKHPDPAIEPVASTTFPVILTVTSSEPVSSASTGASSGGYLVPKSEPNSSFFCDVQPTELISIKSEPMEESTSEHSRSVSVYESDSHSAEVVLPRIERFMTLVERKKYLAQETVSSNSEDSSLQPPFMVCKKEVVWSDEEL